MHLTRLAEGDKIYLSLTLGQFEKTLAGEIIERTEEGVLVRTSLIEKLLTPAIIKGKGEVAFESDSTRVKWSDVEFGVTEFEGKKYISCKSDSEGVEFNRREAFRIDVNIETQVIVSKDTKHDATIVDVSTVGIGFKTTADLPVGSVISVRLEEEKKLITPSFTVVRSLEDKGCKRYGARVLVESPEYRQFVMGKQLEMLRRRRLV